MWMLIDEATRVVRRQNRMLASEAVLTMEAISALLDKKASRSFKATIRGLMNGK